MARQPAYFDSAKPHQQIGNGMKWQRLDSGAVTVVCYDADGDLVWEETVPGDDWDRATAAV